MKTMSEDLINYGEIIGIQKGEAKGALENAIDNIKNLIANTGWTAEKVMTMSGVSDELKPKIIEELAKTDD